MLLHYLVKQENTKTACLYSNAVLLLCHTFNHSLIHVFHLADSKLILTLLYDSLNVLVSGVQLWTVEGHSSGERKMRILHSNS